MKIYLAGYGHRIRENEELARKGDFLISYAATLSWFPQNKEVQARLDWIAKINEDKRRRPCKSTAKNYSTSLTK